MAKTNITQEFATFLKAKRLAIGLDQKQMAVILFGNENRQDYISKIETGKRNISLQSMNAILESLNAGVEFIEF